MFLHANAIKAIDGDSGKVVSLMLLAIVSQWAGSF